MSEPAGEGLPLRRYRALQEMMALARAILWDEVVTDEEARLFGEWMEGHPDLLGLPAAEGLIALLRDYFADGKLSEKQRSELKRMLEELSGEVGEAPEA